MPRLSLTAATRPLVSSIILLASGITGLSAVEYWTQGYYPISNGYTAETWFSSDFPSDGWAGMKITSAYKYDILWSQSRYGFLHRMRVDADYLRIDSGKSTAIAYHNHTIEPWNNQGGALVACYGWTWDPQCEWYIIDDWYGTKPTVTGTSHGSFTCDGNTYDIYYSYTSWHQWWSINRTKRTSGNISYMKHLKKWREKGFGNAEMQNIGFAVESKWGSASSGQVRFNSISIARPN